MNLTIEQAKRFWRKVDKSGGKSACWPWTGARSANAGSFRVGDDVHAAHRVAAHIHLGPCPPGHEAVHVGCTNPLCCQPEHLDYLTPAEKLAIHRANGMVTTTNHLRGSELHTSKLTPRTVRWIRKAVEVGFTQYELAERFGVTQPVVSRAARGETWAHV